VSKKRKEKARSGIDGRPGWTTYDTRTQCSKNYHYLESEKGKRVNRKIVGREKNEKKKGQKRRKNRRITLR